jgi:phage repressor protein C with HTH and peptisase S24 domain
VRRLGLLLGAALFVSGCAALLGSRRFTRVAVRGHSMEPGLLDGDWLLVDRTESVFVQNDIVVARDPRERSRLIVKRVSRSGTDSELWLVSDHAAHFDEVIGPVARSDVIGRALIRYWPPSRATVID